MASRTTISSSLAFLLVLNLLFFTITTAHGCGCPSTPIPNPSPKPKPKPKPTPSPSPGAAKCPIDVLKLGVCGDVLGSLINLGTPPTEQCCSVIQGLLDLEAAVCLCTAIKANILGINLNVSVSLSLLLNVCGKKVPPGFQCPN